MKICIVTETYPPEVNGVAMTISRLVTGLQQRKHQVHIIRPKQDEYDRPGCCNTPATTLVRGIAIPRYPGLRMGITRSKRLYKLWQQRRPDVIYVATEGPLGYAAVNAACKLGIPMISGFHTNFHTYTEHYNLKILKQTIFKYLRNFHNRTAATLVPNQKLASELDEMGINNVRIFSRGVDCSLFNPARRCPSLRKYWGAQPSTKVLLYVGRLAHEKNIELAIKAYRRILQTNTDCKFVLVGDGPLYSDLQRKNPDIIFCGIHRGTALAKYYASADIFLFPSETETFGNVTLEAMASGLAVLGFDYAAANMHIRHTENGFVVPFSDHQAFIEQAHTILAEAMNLADIRKQARQQAESIDWNAHIQLFENLLVSAFQQKAA